MAKKKNRGSNENGASAPLPEPKRQKKDRAKAVKIERRDNSSEAELEMARSPIFHPVVRSELEQQAHSPRERERECGGSADSLYGKTKLLQRQDPLISTLQNRSVPGTHDQQSGRNVNVVGQGVSAPLAPNARPVTMTAANLSLPPKPLSSPSSTMALPSKAQQKRMQDQLLGLRKWVYLTNTSEEDEVEIDRLFHVARSGIKMPDTTSFNNARADIRVYTWKTTLTERITEEAEKMLRQLWSLQVWLYVQAEKNGGLYKTEHVSSLMTQAVDAIRANDRKAFNAARAEVKELVLNLEMDL